MRRKFWKHYRIYVITMLVLILIVSVIFYLFLDSYEKGRSTYLAQSVVDSINNKNYKDIIKNIEIDKFTSEEYYQNILSNYQNVSYEKKMGVYKDDIPVYSITSDDKEIAVVTLKASDKKGLFNINRWEFDNIELSLEKSDITVVIPHNIEVFINGNKIDDSYLKDSNYYPDNIKNIKDKIEFEPLNEYVIKDIYVDSIVTLSKGTVIKNDSTYTYDFGSNETLLNEVKGYLENLCYDYNRYVSNEHAFGKFTPYLLTGTPTYKFMSGVQYTNVWSKKHSPTVFSNFKLDNMQVYSDSLFSIRATYHYEYVVNGTDTTRAYDADITLLMVKKNDKWLLGDLTT